MTFLIWLSLPDVTAARPPIYISDKARSHPSPPLLPDKSSHLRGVLPVPLCPLSADERAAGPPLLSDVMLIGTSVSVEL